MTEPGSTRHLSQTIAGRGRLSIPATTRLWGVIASVQRASLTLTLQGSTTQISGVRYLSSYVPQAGDVVVVQAAGSDLVVIGELSGDVSNEAKAGRLLNVTSAGDAGGRADHFLDSALASRWTQMGTAPTNISVTASVLGVQCAASQAATIYATPYTPSGAFRVVARVRCTYVANNWSATGLLVRDSAVGDTVGDGMLVQIDTSANTAFLYSLDAGVYTVRGSQTLHAAEVMGGWSYVSLFRNASNVWSAGWSADRGIEAAVGTWTKSFTVAQFGPRFSGATSSTFSSCDFVDVTS